MNETFTNKLTNIAKSIRNFFWWTAGVVPSVLEKCETNQGIYTAIGMMVCFISILACISFAFFLSSSFEISPLVAILGGMGWAGLIYALERVVLTSLRKGETSIVTIVLRFALVIATAFVITEPLTLFFFRKEISLEMVSKGRSTVTNARQEVTARFQDEIDSLERNKAEIQTRFDNLKSDRDEKEKAVISEVEGKSATGKTGFGIAAKQKETAFIDADAKYKEFKTESTETLNQNNARLAEIRQEIEAQTKLTEETSNGADGILARQEALFSIVSHNFGVAKTYISILLILMLIETLPLTFKVFGKQGVYDMALADTEAKQIAEIKARNTFETESLERSRSLLKAQADKFLQIIINDNIESLNDANDIRVCNTLKAEALRRIEDEVFQREAKLLEDADFADVITVEVIGRADMNIRLQVPKNAQKTLSLKTIGGDIQSIADSIGGKLQLAKALSSANREISANLPLLTQLEKDFKMLLLFEPLGET